MTVEDKLRQAFQPTALTIIDDSHKHAGHRGSSGGSHLSVRIVSTRFSGLSQVARHKLVYQTLASEMKGSIHALAIEALTPDEASV